MKTISIFLTLGLLTGCLSLKQNEVYLYGKADFNNSYRKYLVNDGFVKYLLVKQTGAILDTTIFNLYFDNFGANEYIQTISDNTTFEVLKSDSLQYSKSSSTFFDSSNSRQSDYLFETIITNSTSRLFMGFSCRKPLDKRFKKVICNDCWIHNNSNPQLNDYRAKYYKGIPVELYQFGYGQDSTKYFFNAIKIDTTIAFPLILKIK